jgi:hypothetical protein
VTALALSIRQRAFTDTWSPRSSITHFRYVARNYFRDKRGFTWKIRMKCPEARPIFIIRLVPIDDRDGIRSLRWALKFVLRRFGLRAISVEEIRHDSDGHQHSVAADRRHLPGGRRMAGAVRGQDIHSRHSATPRARRVVHCVAADHHRSVINLGDGLVSRPGPFAAVSHDIPYWLIIAAIIAAFTALLIALVLVQLRNRR